MATTSPDNIRTPDLGDSYNLVPDLQTMANDTQDALIERANAYKGTTAQRTAFTSQAEDGVLWQDTNGDRRIWTKHGPSNTWREVNPFEGPYLQSGLESWNETLPGGDTLQTAIIPFSSEGQGDVKVVMVTPLGTGRASYRVFSLNNSGFRVEVRNLTSISTGTLSFYWLAFFSAP